MPYVLGFIHINWPKMHAFLLETGVIFWPQIKMTRRERCIVAQQFNKDQLIFTNYDKNLMNYDTDELKDLYPYL